MMEWISVEDELPKNTRSYGMDILVFRYLGGNQRKRVIEIQTFNKKRFWELSFDITNEVKFWMPLPEPPKHNSK